MTAKAHQRPAHRHDTQERTNAVELIEHQQPAGPYSTAAIAFAAVGSRDDLALLPEEVRAAATRTPGSGEEFSWPLATAERAINALTDAGFVILGLDVRRYDEGTFETAWSAFEPERSATAAANIENSRVAALDALGRDETPEFGDWILITWARPGRLPE